MIDMKQGTRARHSSGSTIKISLLTLCNQSSFISSAFYWFITVITGLAVISTGNTYYQNDRAAHWLRIEQLRAGVIIPQLSQDNPGLVVGNLDGNVVQFNNTAVNSPLAYLPSVIFRGDFLSTSIFTLFFTATIIALAIFIAKDFRYAILATALLPMTFFSLTFPTADAMINSTSLLFIACVLRFYQSEKITWLRIVCLTILAAILGQVKITCVLVSFFVLVLIRHAQKLSMKLSLSLPILISIVSMRSWYSLVSNIAGAPQKVTLEQSAELMTQIKLDPLGLLKSWLRTLFEPISVDAETIDGIKVNARRNLQIFTGTETVQLATAVIVPILIAIAIITIVGASERRISGWKEITVPILISCAYFAATCTAMLVTWAGTSSGYASGIQNRYFIPIMPLLLLLIPKIFHGTIHQKIYRLTVASLVIFTYVGITISFVITWA